MASGRRQVTRRWRKRRKHLGVICNLQHGKQSNVTCGRVHTQQTLWKTERNAEESESFGASVLTFPTCCSKPLVPTLADVSPTLDFSSFWDAMHGLFHVLRIQCLPLISGLVAAVPLRRRCGRRSPDPANQNNRAGKIHM